MDVDVAMGQIPRSTERISSFGDIFNQTDEKEEPEVEANKCNVSITPIAY